jgi:DmsE family decaheme c-type cytochrome
MRATTRTVKVKPWRALLVLWLGSLPLAAAGAEQAAGVSEEPAEYMGADICESCHEDIGTAMRMNPHGQSADPRTPSARDGCESCHGPGSLHVEADGESSAGMLGFHPVSDESTEHQNAACLACHQGKRLMHWQASAHDNEDTACSSCHTVHLPDRVLERSTQAEVCYGCHRTIRSQTYQASTHPIRAGKVVCSDCHNAHGGMGPAELADLSINENCYACHAEKRGPFLWEHYPATEDCSLCHRVHGSIHPYLLTRQGPQLCQQCHEDIRAQGRRHVRRFFDFDDPDAARDRFIVGLNCMNCHSQVHGSNHPSGAYLLR